MTETRKRFVYLAGTDLDGWACKRCDAEFPYNQDFWVPKPRRTFAAFLSHGLVRHARLPKVFVQQDMQQLLRHKTSRVSWLIEMQAAVVLDDGDQS